MRLSTTAIALWRGEIPVGIRLITRRGNDWSDRFPLVVEAVNHLKVRSCLIDGEVVCCDERAGPVRRPAPPPQRGDAFLYAFDLLELDGTDLRREPHRGAQGDLGLGSRYRSGRTSDWLKFKNPEGTGGEAGGGRGLGEMTRLERSGQRKG